MQVSKNVSGNVSDAVLIELANDLTDWRIMRNVLNLRTVTIRMWIDCNHKMFQKDLTDDDILEIYRLSNTQIVVN